MNSALYLAWHGGDNGPWGPVGRLELLSDGDYRFLYTRGAMSLPGFEAFTEMPRLDTIYESEELFPLFANRLLSKRRPEYQAYLTWGGFDPLHPPDPIAIMGVTEGRRETDSLELYPCPQPDATGCYINKFFLHGVRWMSAVFQLHISTLQEGENLALMFDDFNVADSAAVAVRTCRAGQIHMIGYVPRYLAREVRELCEHCDPDVLLITVERVNPKAPLQQRLLCRMRACWPSGFQPCSGDEFKTIVGNLPVGVE